jgi:hypothetical protein
MHGPTCIFWANLTPCSLKSPAYEGVAQPGENFTFQLAVYAPAAGIAVTAVSFSDLVTSGSGAQQRSKVIAGSALRCMNMGGVDFWGRSFRHPAVAVGAGEVRALWVAAVVPVTAGAGVYRGRATVHDGRGQWRSGRGGNPADSEGRGAAARRR